MAGGTVTYVYPVAGGVAPTAAQSLTANTVVANLAMGDGATDDDTDIVHNLNLAPADGTRGIPSVSFVTLLQGAALTAPKIVYKDKDTITVAKTIKGGGSDVTWRFTIRRPHTISM